MSPRRAAAPGAYADQVARRAEFERARPDARISHSAPDWTGSLMVGRHRRTVCRQDLRLLLDGLEALAAADEQMRGIEAEFPGWYVWRSDVGRWWASRTGNEGWTPGTERPLTLTADDADGLRAELETCAEREAAAVP